MHDVNEVPDTFTVEEERYMAPPLYEVALHDMNEVPDTVTVEEERNMAPP